MLKSITFKGGELTLLGIRVSVGGKAPGFRVISQDLKDVYLSDFKGKIKVISSFPSLDTPVCDLQVKEFNKRASRISGDTAVIGISKDLPFAQKRFCRDNGIGSETVLSDYKYSSFGINYGLLIKELNLLARSVMIIDRNDILRYFQISGELTESLDYDAAIKNLDEAAKKTAVEPDKSVLTKCVPCEVGTPPIEPEKVNTRLAALKGWDLIDGRKIAKEFKFKDFTDAKYFTDVISLLSDEQGHHPLITLSYGKVRITLTTHASGGLTENDFIMAGLFDAAVI